MPRRRAVIDQAIVETADLWQLVEPVHWSVSIYDGIERYEDDLIAFSKPQRVLFAISWYRYEVLNGGHAQFFDNSTGIVWADALEGFRLSGATTFASILDRAAARFGIDGPSRDRDQRQDFLDEHKIDFDDLDDEFSAAEDGGALDAAVLAWARRNPAAFVFDGFIGDGS